MNVCVVTVIIKWCLGFVLEIYKFTDDELDIAGSRRVCKFCVGKVKDYEVIFIFRTKDGSLRSILSCQYRRENTWKNVHLVSNYTVMVHDQNGHIVCGGHLGRELGKVSYA